MKSLIPKYQTPFNKLQLLSGQYNMQRMQEFPELGRYYTADGRLKDKAHYDPLTNLNNPFYDADTDTYGTYSLPEVPVTYTFDSNDERQHAQRMAEGRRGGQYVRNALEEVSPYLLPLVAAPAAAAMSSYGLLQPILDLSSLVADPLDPLNLVPYAGTAHRIASRITRAFPKLRASVGQAAQDASQAVQAVASSSKPQQYASTSALEFPPHIRTDGIPEGLGERYTQLLLDLLAHSKKDPSITKAIFNKWWKPRWTPGNKQFVRYLADLGVDVTKFTPEDINRLQELRSSSISDNLPKDVQEVILKQDFTDFGDKYLLVDTDKGIDEVLGDLVVRRDYDGVTPYTYINMISAREPGHNVSEKLYNQAIMDSEGGLVSGEELLSPEITINTLWPKYKDRVLFSNDGRHLYGSGEYVDNAVTQAQGRDVINEVLDDQPVMLLKHPSDLPLLKVKSISRFHPEMVDEATHTLKPPKWDSTNPYMSVIPAMMIGGGTAAATLLNQEE